MGLAYPPTGLRAEVSADGARARVGGWDVAINEWELVLDERSLFGAGRRVVIPLSALTALRVAGSSRAANHFALVLGTADETFHVGSGAPLDHLMWVAEAIQEAERTRARREGVQGREYLFDRVVPDDVSELLKR